MFISINPSTEELIKEFPYLSDDKIDGILLELEHFFVSWRTKTIEGRITFLPKLIEVLVSEEEEIAQIITREVGKPITQSRLEVQKCASLCHYYHKYAAILLKDKVIESELIQSKVVYKPLGIIFGIMPWNFPLWQVFRFAIPTIIAGNVVALKHAPNVGLLAKKIEEIFQGLAIGKAYANLFVSNEQSERILANRKVKGVSLTGSSKAGSAVASLAAKYLKPQLLELGGSDVFIVDSQVDLFKVIEEAIKTRLQNNGQSCIAGKRFLIHEEVFEAFVTQLIAKLKYSIIGNPASEESNLGPLARKDLKTQYQNQVLQGKSMGAKTLFTLSNKPKYGYYVDIDVVEINDVENVLFQEEIFGPCFVLKRIKSFKEAIEIANQSAFGLSASVWTTNENHKKMAIDHIESGAVFINKMSKSEPRFSFGGIKESGYGRELGEEGLKSFVNQKLIIEG